MKEETVLRKVDVAKSPQKSGLYLTNYGSLKYDVESCGGAWFTESGNREWPFCWYEEILSSEVVEQPKTDAVNEDLLNKIKDDVAHKFSGKKWEDTPDRFKDIYVNYVILRYLESTITVPSKDNKEIEKLPVKPEVIFMGAPELPTDEEIKSEAEKRNPYVKHMVDWNNGMHEGFIDGADWMRDKLSRKD